MKFFDKYKNDIILIAIILFLALGAWCAVIFTREPGKEVMVSIDGNEVLRLPLDEDTQIVLGEGEHTNTLLIENGSASITGASCPDHVCVKKGAISYSGESIVCLPNKTVVSICGGTETEYDGVAG